MPAPAAPTLKVSYTGHPVRERPDSPHGTNLDGALRFDQSGGTIDIDGQGATAAQNNERGLFEVQGKGSIFRMSGGALNLHRSNGRPTIAADLYLAPDSTVVTGGTVVLGNSASRRGQRDHQRELDGAALRPARGNRGQATSTPTPAC